MYYTTLRKLRVAGACTRGHNKLVCALSGQTFDPDRCTYIMHRHDVNIPLDYILNSNGLDDALWTLRASDCTDRDARLYAVACARAMQHLMTDGRSIAALDVAERYANGNATDEELAAAREAAVRCLHLPEEGLCGIFGREDLPAICSSFTASEDICGSNAQEATQLIRWFERETSNG